jgi:hypothetical protein
LRNQGLLANTWRSFFEEYHEMIVQMIVPTIVRTFVPWRHRADKPAGAV